MWLLREWIMLQMLNYLVELVKGNLLRSTVQLWTEPNLHVALCTYIQGIWKRTAPMIMDLRCMPSAEATMQGESELFGCFTLACVLAWPGGAHKIPRAQPPFYQLSLHGDLSKLLVPAVFVFGTGRRSRFHLEINLRAHLSL